jgi:hypothetical protein
MGGVLDISITSDLLNEQADAQNISVNRWLDFNEWLELFENVLQAPVEIERLEDENFQDYHARRERLFQEDLTGKGYEMLGRIWYIFSDAFFHPSEIDKLLEECLELQQKTEYKHALSALEKLIHACNEALKVKSGIFLACD